MVIWLLGLSGAGKTTLGKRLAQHFTKNRVPHYLIDGDEVRNFFDNDLGHTVSDREMNLKRIIYAAHVLEKNKIQVIVCSISPFEKLRNMAREKLQNYREIYLKTNVEKKLTNDPRDVYKNNLGKTPLVGIDIPFEIPQYSDLVVDTEKQSPEESLQVILNYLEENPTHATHP